MSYRIPSHNFLPESGIAINKYSILIQNLVILSPKILSCSKVKSIVVTWRCVFSVQKLMFVVVTFDALARASDFRIEVNRRQLTICLLPVKKLHRFYGNIHILNQFYSLGKQRTQFFMYSIYIV